MLSCLFNRAAKNIMLKNNPLIYFQETELYKTILANCTSSVLFLHWEKWSDFLLLSIASIPSVPSSLLHICRLRLSKRQPFSFYWIDTVTENSKRKNFIIQIYKLISFLYSTIIFHPPNPFSFIIKKLHSPEIRPEASCYTDAINKLTIENFKHFKECKNVF
jgi:hypothetical protein